MQSLEIKTTEPIALDSWDLRLLAAQDFEVLKAITLTLRPRNYRLLGHFIQGSYKGMTTAWLVPVQIHPEHQVCEAETQASRHQRLLPSLPDLSFKCHIG